MTTNYFDNLPISTELQLALSALVAPATSGESADMPYVLLGSYEPAVSSNALLTGTTFGPLGYRRVGPGPGPAAGDHITLFGTISVHNAEAGAESAQLSFPLPFEAVEGPTGPTAATYQVPVGSAASIVAFTTDVAFALDVADWAAVSINSVWFQCEYITANAEDPA